MDPRAVLCRYLEVVDQLSRSSYIKRTDSVHLSYEWKQGGPLVTTLQEPHEEVLKAFLIDFRLLFLQKEPIALNRIYNLCDRYLINETLVRYLRTSRKYWKQIRKRSGVRFVMNGKPYSPEMIVDLWINGFYFHRDEKKLAELKRLESCGLKVHRAEFLFFLEDAVEHVFYVAHVVKAALREGYFQFDREATA